MKSRTAKPVTMGQMLQFALAALFPGKHVLVVHARYERDREDHVIPADAVRAFLREHVAFPAGVQEHADDPFVVIELSGAQEAAEIARALDTRCGFHGQVYACGVKIGDSRWDVGARTPEEHAAREAARRHPRATLFCACGRNFYNSVDGLADLAKHERVCRAVAMAG